MKTNKEKLNKILKEFTKKELIEFSLVLYEKYVLENRGQDYTKLSNVVLGLLRITIGISYDNMHPTDESRMKESYDEWLKKFFNQE